MSSGATASSSCSRPIWRVGPDRDDRDHRVRARRGDRLAGDHDPRRPGQPAHAAARPDRAVPCRQRAVRGGVDIASLSAFRFVTGSVQGAYFGAGAVVAGYVYGPGRGGQAFATVMAGLTVATIVGSPLGTFIGQHAGWRAMYWTVVGLGLLATPRSPLAPAHRRPARSLGRERARRGLRSVGVWLMFTVAALGISSIFAVYTFIGPFITDAAQRGRGAHPGRARGLRPRHGRRQPCSADGRRPDPRPRPRSGVTAACWGCSS